MMRLICLAAMIVFAVLFDWSTEDVESGRRALTFLAPALSGVGLVFSFNALLCSLLGEFK